MFGNRFHKLVFLIITVPFLTHAAPNDQQNIDITSHAFEYNHQTGIAVYTGKVFAKQGTRFLWGDTLEVYRGSNGDVDKIVVLGKPAKLEQEGDVYEAPRIEYDVAKEIVRSPQNEKGQTTITLKPRAKS